MEHCTRSLNNVWHLICIQTSGPLPTMNESCDRVICCLCQHENRGLTFSFSTLRQTTGCFYLHVKIHVFISLVQRMKKPTLFSWDVSELFITLNFISVGVFCELSRYFNTFRTELCVQHINIHMYSCVIAHVSRFSVAVLFWLFSEHQSPRAAVVISDSLICKYSSHCSLSWK